MAGRTISATYNSLVTLTSAGDNPVLIDTTAALDAGLYGSSGTDWTVTNNGVIATGVAGFSGARSPGAAVLMASESTITNYGSISASGSEGVGVYLEAGGSVTNQGMIAASGGYGYGIYLTGGGTVTNYGTVQGSSSGIVIARQAGLVTNAGTVIGDNLVGIDVTYGGTVVNQYGGTIRGLYEGAFLTNVNNLGALLTNGGTVGASSTGTYSFGVVIDGGGAVTNQAGGVIAGYQAGIKFYNTGSGTVVNAGTIVGSAVGGAAIAFSHDYPNLLVVEPGAVFVGTVDGGDTIGGANINTLELAPGTMAGTLGGIGYQFTDFAYITVDYGAAWTLTATNSIASGATLISAGTLFSDGTLINAGSIGGGGGYPYGLVALIGGSVTNALGASISASNGIAIYGPNGASAATVVNAGSIYGYGIGVYLMAGGVVTNLSTGTIGGQGGVGIVGGAGTLINQGSIYGLYSGAFVETGVVTNSASGRITGSLGGVRIEAGTLTNYGTIIGTKPFVTPTYGVELGDATLINNVGGKVSGVAYGVFVSASGAATIVNQGNIGGGGAGVYGYSETTLTNGGTITGVGLYSVELGAGYANRLIIDPGAVFNGAVDGSYVPMCGCAGPGTDTSTLELASGGVGALSGLGSQYIGFAAITIDSSASWVLTGSNSLAAGTTLTNSGALTLSSASLIDSDTLVNDGVIVLDPSTLSAAALIGVGSATIDAGGELAVLGTVTGGETIDFGGGSGVLALDDAGGFAGTIDGFVSGLTIDLTSVAHSVGDHASLIGSNTLEVVTSGSGTFDVQLDPSRDYFGATFALTADGGGTGISVNVACFAAGTRLLTVRGEVAVEALRAGDCVLNAGGVARAVRWVGSRAIDLSRHADPDAVRPIRILANAFADGVPRRELRLSPDHAVLVDGVLVPVRLLVNGASIVRATECRAVTYYHVELDTHDVLLAEGLPAESYLDTGNRGMFANAGVPLVLHPDFGEGQRRRVAGSCAPLVCVAEQIEPLWRRLMARAVALGFAGSDASAMVHDAALRVMAGGRAIAASSIDGERHVFVLPPTDGSVRLTSRCFVPSERRPWVGDRRRLGVMVRRLMLRSDAGVAELPLDHPLLEQGWWDVEREQRSVWRWTDGDAVLPLPVAGGGVLEVTVGLLAEYAAEPAVEVFGRTACAIG